MRVRVRVGVGVCVCVWRVIVAGLLVVDVIVIVIVIAIAVRDFVALGESFTCQRREREEESHVGSTFYHGLKSVRKVLD